MCCLRAQVDPDKAFAVQVAHEEGVLTTSAAYMQCALLYTSSSGERRIRCALPQQLCADSISCRGRHVVNAAHVVPLVLQAAISLLCTSSSGERRIRCAASAPTRSHCAFSVTRSHFAFNILFVRAAMYRLQRQLHTLMRCFSSSEPAVRLTGAHGCAVLHA